MRFFEKQALRALRELSADTPRAHREIYVVYGELECPERGIMGDFGGYSAIPPRQLRILRGHWVPRRGNKEGESRQVLRKHLANFCNAEVRYMLRVMVTLANTYKSAVHKSFK